MVIIQHCDRRCYRKILFEIEVVPQPQLPSTPPSHRDGTSGGEAGRVRVASDVDRCPDDKQSKYHFYAFGLLCLLLFFSFSLTVALAGKAAARQQEPASRVRAEKRTTHFLRSLQLRPRTEKRTSTWRAEERSRSGKWWIAVRSTVNVAKNRKRWYLDQGPLQIPTRRRIVQLPCGGPQPLVGSDRLVELLAYSILFGLFHLHSRIFECNPRSLFLFLPPHSPQYGRTKPVVG